MLLEPFSESSCSCWCFCWLKRCAIGINQGPFRRLRVGNQVVLRRRTGGRASVVWWQCVSRCEALAKFAKLSPSFRQAHLALAELSSSSEGKRSIGHNFLLARRPRIVYHEHVLLIPIQCMSEQATCTMPCLRSMRTRTRDIPHKAVSIWKSAWEARRRGMGTSGPRASDVKASLAAYSRTGEPAKWEVPR